MDVPLFALGLVALVTLLSSSGSFDWLHLALTIVAVALTVHVWNKTGDEDLRKFKPGYEKAKISAAASSSTTNAAAALASTASAGRNAAGLLPEAPFTSRADLQALADREVEDLQATVAAAKALINNNSSGGGSGASKYRGSPWTPLIDLWEDGNRGLVVLQDNNNKFKFLVVAQMSCPASHAFRLLSDEKNWKSDALEQAIKKGTSQKPVLKAIRRVGEPGPNAAIVHAQSLAVLMVGAREAVCLVDKRRLPNGDFITAGFSTQDDSAPVDPKSVLIDVRHVSAIFSPRELTGKEKAFLAKGNVLPFPKWEDSGEELKGCTIHFLVEVDPKAWVPNSLIRMLVSQLGPIGHSLISKIVLHAPRWSPSVGHVGFFESESVASPSGSVKKPSAAAVVMSSSSAAALIKPVVIKAKKVNTLATVRGALVWAKPFMIAIIYAIAMYHLARLFALRRRALAQ